MAGEFLSTTKQMHVVARTSQPGVSRSNAVAQRAVRASLEVTRTLRAGPSRRTSTPPVVGWRRARKTQG
eukprot:9753943-Alexandrium_andersonii.AAC.1